MKEGQLESIFNERIKRRVFRGAANHLPLEGGSPPVLVLLGGQLAAGKSYVLKDVSERHENVVLISPDEFRPFHPHYDDIMRDDPLNMSRLTAPAMREWQRMCEDYAYENGIGIVVEGTFIKPDKPLDIAERLARDPENPKVPHQGFQTEVIALAVPEERSRLDMVGRFLSSPPGEGRGAVGWDGRP